MQTHNSKAHFPVSLDHHVALELGTVEGFREGFQVSVSMGSVLTLPKLCCQWLFGARRKGHHAGRVQDSREHADPASQLSLGKAAVLFGQSST